MEIALLALQQAQELLIQVEAVEALHIIILHLGEQQEQAVLV